MSKAKLPPWWGRLASPKRQPAGLAATRASRKQRSFLVDLAIRHGLADDGGAIQATGSAARHWIRLYEAVLGPRQSPAASYYPEAVHGRSIDGWAAKLTGLQASQVIDVLKDW